ncbi:MAG: VWA domain-containing protein [Candidatus Hydrogenedentes bacterium]|nr:VWA domain-containing protein [Candidatus Hydrogenedentota bacterium]
MKSNGGNKTLEVTMQVPLRPVIGVIPDNLDFGLNGDTASVFVGNIGDAGTVLNFLVVSDRPWLFLSPATGTSIGTDSVVKDYQTINVSIDRSALESSGGTATITVFAIDALGEIDPNIEPETITVSVEAAELSFQTPLVSTRKPSMLRYSMIMRDIRNESFIVDPLLLSDTFRIFEDGILIEEPSETTQQVFLQNSTLTAPVSDERIDLRIRTVLLLDYSGSMRDAADAAGTDIQSLYELVGSQFIDDYFAYFSNVERGFATMSIMEFHDRNVNVNLVQDFTDDPTTLKNALDAIDIDDNGATALLPAILDTSKLLVDADFPYVSFDNTDIRAIALFSDGRLTTPPGEIQDYLDVLIARRVRLVPVGWGVDVNHEPLARLAAETGGHYYLTTPDTNNVPTVPNFSTRVEDLNRDLASHTVLSYVTLGEEESVPIRFDGVLNDPNDDPDQGVIQGTLEEQNINLSEAIGDILMGQISMRTTGVQSGATQVTLRADYIPRNINKFQFDLSSTEAFAIGIVPHDEGGLVEGWTLTDLGGGLYSLTAPTVQDVLPYGSYGDLVRLTFAAVGATPFTVALNVDNTIYSVDTLPKYFIYPDTIDVDTEPFLAPAFPTPNITPATLAFGTTDNALPLDIRNIGGSYPYVATPNVLLEWETDNLPSFVSSVTPETGFLSNTTEIDNALVTINRTGAPGTFAETLSIAWRTGTLGLEGSWPILVTTTILPPVLQINGDPVTFTNVPQGGGTVTQTFEITNSGQSTLDWAIVLAGLPAWIQSITPNSGTTVNGEIDTITVTLDPSTLPPNSYSTTINVLSDGGNDNVTVNVSTI